MTELSMSASPIYAAILIGGKSRRMGRPKHLLKTDSKTWLERTVHLLSSQVDRTVLVGEGELPFSSTSLPRLFDVDGIGGPLAGILAAMRSAPEADWLILACDMPAVTEASVHWLLGGRSEHWWGRVPRLEKETKFCEPLFALYNAPARQLFEALLQQGKRKISLVADHPKIETPCVPDILRSSWQNINTPEELLVFQNSSCRTENLNM